MNSETEPTPYEVGKADKAAIRTSDGVYIYSVPSATSGFIPPTPADSDVTLTKVRWSDWDYMLIRSPAPLDKPLLLTVDRTRYTGYSSLRDGATASPLPERVTSKELDDYGDRIQAMYQPEYEKWQEWYTLDLSAVKPVDVEGLEDSVLDALPRNWKPCSAAMLLGPLSVALHPGWLTGFSAAARAVATQHGEVRPVGYADKNSDFEINIRLRYDPPRTTLRSTGRGRSTRKERVETWHTVTVKVAAPDKIGGGNLAQAQARWDARLREIEAELLAASTPRICSHCDGWGIVTVNGEPAVRP